MGPEHEESNYRMAHEALLSHLPVGEDQIFRIEGEAGDIRASAQRYHDILDNQLSKDASGIPQFDLVLLGLGPDGHIASLFPDTDALDVTDRYAVAVWVEKFNTWRISITFPLINHARHVWLFVSGGGKADIVADIFAAGHTTRRYPVQLIDAQGDICWYLDHAAAAKLP